ncbi:MAG: hypothetical protein WCJ18_00235 [Planctomycetota bacterium]
MSDALHIDKLDAETIKIPLVGTAPLIVHKWSEKAKLEMLANMQGKKRPKENKDPQAEYLASMYRIANENGEDEYGFPAVGFKTAMVDACRYYDKSCPMTLIRQCVFVRGIVTKADPQQLVRLLNTDGGRAEPMMREDVVTVGRNGKDLRYRGEFSTWQTELSVTYVKSSISRESVVSLLDASGMGVGVGEWRPQRGGDYGTYMIDPARAIQVVS